MTRSARHSVPAAALVALALSALSLAFVADAGAAVLNVRTVPAVPGVRIVHHSDVYVTGPDGAVRVTGFSGLTASLQVPTLTVRPGVRASLGRWYRKVSGPRDRATAGLNVYYRVGLRFVDLHGAPVDPKLITSVRLKSRTGVHLTVSPRRAVWLFGTRSVPFGGQLQPKQIQWSVEGATVAGMQVVNRAQQRFYPIKTRAVTVRLLFFTAHFQSRDAIFRFPIGKSIKLSYPNGRLRTSKLGHGGKLTLTALPRGDYKVSVDAPGFSFTRPVSISRDQQVKLQVISYLDVLVVLALVIGAAATLVLVRRPRMRRRLATAPNTLRTAAAWSIPDAGHRRRPPPAAPAQTQLIDLYPDLDLPSDSLIPLPGDSQEDPASLEALEA
jgi:hypothetical protein